MKKSIVVFSLFTLFVFTANAQKIDASKVPASVKASFEKQFPGISPKWEMENGKYEAGFKSNGKIMSALFETNGALSETEVDIKTDELPVGVLAYVKEHYSGKSIKESAKITKADGTVNYEAEVDGKDIIFDSTGKFLKEIKN